MESLVVSMKLLGERKVGNLEQGVHKVGETISVVGEEPSSNL